MAVIAVAYVLAVVGSRVGPAARVNYRFLTYSVGKWRLHMPANVGGPALRSSSRRVSAALFACALDGWRSPSWAGPRVRRRGCR